MPRDLRREVAGRMNYRGEELAPLDLERPAADRRGFPRRRRQGGRDLPAARLRQSRRTSRPWSRRVRAALAGGRRWSHRTRSRASGANTSARSTTRALGLCAADRRALPRPARREPRGARLSRPALHHAVELRRRLARAREGHSDHHGRVRAGVRRVGRGRTRPRSSASPMSSPSISAAPRRNAR